MFCNRAFAFLKTNGLDAIVTIGVFCLEGSEHSAKNNSNQVSGSHREGRTELEQKNGHHLIYRKVFGFRQYHFCTLGPNFSIFRIFFWNSFLFHEALPKFQLLPKNAYYKLRGAAALQPPDSYVYDWYWKTVNRSISDQTLWKSSVAGLTNDSNHPEWADLWMWRKQGRIISYCSFGTILWHILNLCFVIAHLHFSKRMV